jgi:hypothetical protein
MSSTLPDPAQVLQDLRTLTDTNTISAIRTAIDTRVNEIRNIKTNIQKKNGVLNTRQQMLDSLLSLNNYKQKIIYMLICAIVIIFIIFSLIIYNKNGMKMMNKIGNRIMNRKNLS